MAKRDGASKAYERATTEDRYWAADLLTMIENLHQYSLFYEAEYVWMPDVRSIFVRGRRMEKGDTRLTRDAAERLLGVDKPK